MTCDIRLKGGMRTFHVACLACGSEIASSNIRSKSPTINVHVKIHATISTLYTAATPMRDGALLSFFPDFSDESQDVSAQEVRGFDTPRT